MRGSHVPRSQLVPAGGGRSKPLDLLLWSADDRALEPRLLHPIQEIRIDRVARLVADDRLTSTMRTQGSAGKLGFRVLEIDHIDAGPRHDFLGVENLQAVEAAADRAALNLGLIVLGMLGCGE